MWVICREPKVHDIHIPVPAISGDGFLFLDASGRKYPALKINMAESDTGDS